MPAADRHHADEVPRRRRRIFLELFYKRFIKVVKTMELKKSMKRLPTNGTIKNALGAAP